MSEWHKWAQDRMLAVNSIASDRGKLNPAWVNYVIGQLDGRIVELETQIKMLREFYAKDTTER